MKGRGGVGVKLSCCLEALKGVLSSLGFLLEATG